jgi:hypothetical protein
MLRPCRNLNAVSGTGKTHGIANRAFPESAFVVIITAFSPCSTCDNGITFSSKVYQRDLHENKFEIP